MKNNLCRTALETPIGILQLLADDHSLYRIAFPTHPAQKNTVSTAPPEHALLRTVQAQLLEYFQGNRQNFDLPLAPRGTEFQQSVWKLMQQIPYGRTKTYGELASLLGDPNKARAVGGAANKNPLPIVIPCHRVMGASGSLTGFAGGLSTKQFLLDLEHKKAQPSVQTDN